MKKSISDLIGVCKKGSCDCLVIDAFIENVSDDEIYLFDGNDDDNDGSPFVLVEDWDKCQVRITNESNEPYTLVKVDNCLIVSKERRKCDAILYNDKSFFYIEIKDVNKKGRSGARTEAIQQLLSTIDIFEGLEYGERAVFAVIGFKTVQPYVISSANNAKKALFKEMYDIQLMEGSQILLQ